MQRSALNESNQVMTSTSLTIAAPSKDAATEARMANAHPVLHHAERATALQREWAVRAMANANASAQLFALGIDLDSWQDLLLMQQAAWRRLMMLQNGWTQAWRTWVVYSDQIRGANTMSKLVEREGNIVAQFVSLMTSQATDWVGLQENIHVGYSYWVSEKLSEKRKSLSVTAG